MNGILALNNPSGVDMTLNELNHLTFKGLSLIQKLSSTLDV